MLKHQRHNQRHETINNQTSNRSFGLILASFLLLVGLAPLLKAHSARTTPIIIAAIFAIAAIKFPKALTLLNHLWFKIGLILHKIINPLILGIIFFFVVTPLALILRALSVDFLNLKQNLAIKSYWNIRSPPGPKPESMIDLF